MFTRSSLICLIMFLVSCTSTKPLPEPQTMTRSEYIEINYKMQPHIKKAKESLPYAKDKYLRGLKDGEKMFLTVKLYDHDKSFEQLEVAVVDWYENSILGRISSQVFVLQNYHQGDLINFTDDNVVDWTIVRSDGTFEGGYVRKFLKSCGSKKLGHR